MEFCWAKFRITTIYYYVLNEFKNKKIGRISRFLIVIVLNLSCLFKSISLVDITRFITLHKPIFTLF